MLYMIFGCNSSRLKVEIPFHEMGMCIHIEMYVVSFLHSFSVSFGNGGFGMRFARHSV